jgi:cell division protein FtsL
MTLHVAHTNQMISQLKFQYQERVNQLQNKIAEQQKEISKLQEQIKLFSTEKFYDC